jgi:pimeloyl-ACP methyl ester carboxylesterase
VVLLHGWPYDIHSFVDVAPLLASAGYRVIIPYLRGYGTTRFLSSAAVWNGQPSAIAVDLKDLLDALKIEKPILAGFDWGARIAASSAVPAEHVARVSAFGTDRHRACHVAVSSSGRVLAGHVSSGALRGLG